MACLNKTKQNKIFFEIVFVSYMFEIVSSYTDLQIMRSFLYLYNIKIHGQAERSCLIYYEKRKK